MSYNVATFSRLDENEDGSVVMVITHTGDAGEKPREQRIPYEATVQPSADTIRAFAMNRSAVLNRTKNFIIGAQPNVGSVLDITTPLPATAASTYGVFMAASTPFTPGATPQDVFTITGSATKKTQVLLMGLSTIQTTAGMNAWLALKRSTANVGGTSANIAPVAVSKLFPAATAIVKQYTANPTTPGTLVGNLWSGRVPSPAPATVLTGVEKILSFNGVGSPIAHLFDATEVLAWNLNGVALPAGLSVQAFVWWSEQ